MRVQFLASRSYRSAISVSNRAGASPRIAPSIRPITAIISAFAHLWTRISHGMTTHTAPEDVVNACPGKSIGACANRRKPHTSSQEIVQRRIADLPARTPDDTAGSGTSGLANRQPIDATSDQSHRPYRAITRCRSSVPARWKDARRHECNPEHSGVHLEMVPTGQICRYRYSQAAPRIVQFHARSERTAEHNQSR